MAVLPGMIKVEASIVASRVMPNPRSVVVYMRRFGMALVVRPRMRFMRRAMIRGRTVTGDESTADSVAASAMTTMLRPNGQGENQRHSKNSEE
jgi:hypothetical protein